MLLVSRAKHLSNGQSRVQGLGFRVEFARGFDTSCACFGPDMTLNGNSSTRLEGHQSLMLCQVVMLGSWGYSFTFGRVDVTGCA